MQGGRAVSGNALAPRSRRANTAQVNTYWSGIQSGRTGADGYGGTGVQQTSVGGVSYYYTSFIATGSFTVTSAGTFEIYSFGGGNGGTGDNGYNGWAAGGSGGSGGTITKTLSTGSYTITVGAGGGGGQYTAGGTGGNSYFGTDNSVAGTYGVGGGAANGGSGNAPNATGLQGGAGTDVSSFIGGASLFKGAGGTGRAGGAGINGAGAGTVYPTTGGTATANSAAGGGSARGSGQPSLNQGIGGAGADGIVYVRWRA